MSARISSQAVCWERQMVVFSICKPEVFNSLLLGLLLAVCLSDLLERMHTIFRYIFEGRKKKLRRKKSKGCKGKNENEEKKGKRKKKKVKIRARYGRREGKGREEGRMDELDGWREGSNLSPSVGNRSQSGTGVTCPVLSLRLGLSLVSLF